MKKRILTLVKFSFYSVVILLLVSRFLIPEPSFNSAHSTVVLDDSGNLLGARIASDGQWRFPEMDSIPDKFEKCILTFEDKHFRSHPGVNPVSIFRAFKENVKAGRIKQGGSTITMQVARLWQNGKSRTVLQKLKELFIAFHYEVNFSKDEILNLYASHAPFGGNVVGLETAAWRYFGRAPEKLTWSETAALAVLPNAPSLIFPGKNEEFLRQKRDRLLDQLVTEGIISAEENQLAKLENLPSKAKRLPDYASHLVDRAYGNEHGKKTRTSIQTELQRKAQRIINNYADRNGFNEVYNAAAVIMETSTGNIISYVGNSTNSNEHGNAVDVLTSVRSTGSLLKPFLYASTLSKGEILPEMLLTDIPTFISGYAPENYNHTFDGAVPANEALYRSLNVPFVRLLRSHGVKRFHDELKLLDMNTLSQNSGHYGLALILGGAEGNLVELTGMMAGMGRLVKNYDGEYDEEQHFFKAQWNSLSKPHLEKERTNITPAAAYETLNALTEAKRPLAEQGWKSFSSSKKIAWKTGTSFGHRDAWAIGTTPEYTVGVWIGNADGEGRAGLTGLGYAAPVMFDLFEELPSTTWFEKPYDDYRKARVCSHSGHIATTHCADVDTVFIPDVELKIETCPYHHFYHLDSEERYRVNSDCEAPQNMVHKNWFVLQPAQEWYYKLHSPLYRKLPPFRSDCSEAEIGKMEFIYPKSPNKLYFPKYLDGSQGKAVFELAHREQNQKVFWHLDGEYLGMTKDFHQMEIYCQMGTHTLLVTDEQGNDLIKNFEVLSR